MSSNASAQQSTGLLPQLLLDADDLEARRRIVDDEAGHALLGLVRVRHGEEHGRLADPGRRDELLGAVDRVALVRAHRPALQVGGVRARLRLGQGKAADALAGGEGLQPALLLLVAGEPVEHGADGRVVHRDHGRDRAVAGGDLDQRQRIGDVVGPRPAPVRVDGHAEKAELAQLRDDLGLDRARLLALARRRRQPRARIVARHVADHVCSSVSMARSLFASRPSPSETSISPSSPAPPPGRRPSSSRRSRRRYG